MPTTLLWFHANGRNKSQYCWAQQCWVLLVNHVGSVCMDLYIFERLFKPSGTGSKVLKSYLKCIHYYDKAISFDRRYLRQITAAFNLRTWDSDTRIGIISSATESKIIVCNLPFENQLFGYIHYCTEIPDININLLPNTCNFHCKFRFIFS